MERIPGKQPGFAPRGFGTNLAHPGQYPLPCRSQRLSPSSFWWLVNLPPPGEEEYLLKAVLTIGFPLRRPAIKFPYLLRGRYVRSLRGLVKISHHSWIEQIVIQQRDINPKRWPAKTSHSRKLTWIPKMMVWKRWTPLKCSHFWYLC